MKAYSDLEVSELKYVNKSTGQEVREEDLYEVVDEYLSDEDYEKVLNESETPVKLFGQKYSFGRCLRAVDPYYFGQLRDEYIEFVIGELKHGYEVTGVPVKVVKEAEVEYINKVTGKAE